MTSPAPTLIARLAAVWAVLGITLLLGRAITSLTPKALEAMASGTMAPWQWVVLVVWVVIMAYSEGYRGFQKRFSPFVAARVLVLLADPTPLRVVLAPAFCMGFFDATRRRRIVSWSVTLGVLALVFGVRLLDQPWRGLVDAGVVVGLSWGLVSLYVSLFTTLRRGTPAVSAALPDGGRSAA